MKQYLLLLSTFLLIACNGNKAKTISAQKIVDLSILKAGGDLYKTKNISFNFRDIHYKAENENGQRVLSRIIKNDTATIIDVKRPSSFTRHINDSLISLSDSITNVYANSVNSVHYFAYLPYGLNDAAVNKELLGKVILKQSEYYKVKVTFKQQGGGEDFDDVFVYYFNTETYLPDYLAYSYKTNGGGMRFREALNERYIKGARFVDYNNYKPVTNLQSITEIDQAFVNNELKFLSKIELTSITLE